jgi:hypothetical protein
MFAMKLVRLITAASKASEDLTRLIKIKTARLLRTIKRKRKGARRYYAALYRRLEIVRFRTSNWKTRHVRKLFTLAVGGLLIASVVTFQFIQIPIEIYFTQVDLLLSLRSVLGTVGGALMGATAIGFSVVMVAVQLNFARIPHGLFRKLSSDFKLLGAFAATFILAMIVSALSLIPKASWAAFTLLITAWCAGIILILFLYAYRRALALINPLVQLHLIYADADKDMRMWGRRAVRLAPLLENERKSVMPKRFEPTHDIARVRFFQTNPQWTAISRRALTHAISFAHRYAEQNDHEVSRMAIATVGALNAKYVEIKGKTFFSHNPVFDIPLSRDGFITETLEHLRLFVQTAVKRGDEEQIRQALSGISALVGVYSTIDYANPNTTSKQDAQLAAAYLTSAVESVIPHNMPDVLMEGVRLIGQSAQIVLSSNPNDAASLAQNIAGLACLGTVKESYRAVTLVGMEQLARLTLNLILSNSQDIGYATKEIRSAVSLVAKTFLTVQNEPFASTHSSFLAPYYSLSKTDTLGEWLTGLVNDIAEAKEENKSAERAARHLEEWSNELYRTEKELLLYAIQRRSPFTFDMVHWIAHVSKLLVAAAQSPATSDYVLDELEKNASWLLSVLSWIPDDKVSVEFADNYGVTDQIFDVSLDTARMGCEKIAQTARELLLSWALKVGRYNGFTLEKVLRALALTSLWKDGMIHIPWLKAELPKRLAAAPIEQEVVDQAARELRTKAISFRSREFPISRIDAAMQQVDRAKMTTLLKEVADLISPGTANEKVRMEI